MLLCRSVEGGIAGSRPPCLLIVHALNAGGSNDQMFLAVGLIYYSSNRYLTGA